ncbi:MAG: glycosyltransferase family A protein [Byssovorax sp.]
MKVSIIMRSKNSDWVIDQALAGLFAQSYKDFELWVVDSGSTDRTLEMVRRHPAKIVEIPAKSYVPGSVLNAAIARTDGDLVVFQNSDVVPLSPDTLARLIAAFDDPAVDAAFARQIPRPEAHGWVRRDYATSFPEHGPAPSFMPYSLPLAAMRRSAWEKHPFYTDAWGSEDAEWGFWARRNGLVIRYVSSAIVMHSHNYTLKEMYGRRFIEGEADAFIHGGADSVGGLVRRVIGATARDALYCLGARDLGGLLASPVRRAAYHAGYFAGHRHGERRRARGDTDIGKGQRIVLEQLGGAGTREAR